jgi:hypothetical protein
VTDLDATRLAGVLRPGRRALALALAVVAMGVAACGSDEGGTIPSGDAEALLNQLDEVQASIEDGNCEIAQSQVGQLREQVNLLPKEVGAETKGALFRLVGNLEDLVEDPSQCREPDTGTTDLATTTEEATTTPATTAEDTTTTTTAVEEAPPEQPEDEGTGLPPPGNSDNGPPGPSGNPNQGGGDDSGGGIGGD